MYSFSYLEPVCCSMSSSNCPVQLNIQKTNIMASGPITSWKIDEDTVETVSNFIFLGSKITADGDCSYEIKRRLLLGRKVMTNLDSILKSTDITLSTKLPDLHIGFSRGRSGGVVFPSLSEFSTVDCDPHSQRLWHSK